MICGSRLLEYASIRPPVVFSGHTSLLVDGVEVGAVPKLVISAPLRESGVWLNYCDERWNPVGTVALASLAEARRHAERNYPGVSRLWRKAHVSRARALAYERKQWKGHVCSFCGRIPPEFNSSITSGSATICDLCVRGIYAELTTPAV